MTNYLLINVGDTDVADPDTPLINEVQTLTLDGEGVAGTFTLAFGAAVSAALAFDVTAAQIEAALEGLSTVGAGNVEVTGEVGGPFEVTFVGDLAATDVDLIVLDDALLQVNNEDTITHATTVPGTGITITVTTPTEGDDDPATNEEQLLTFTTTPLGGTFTITITEGTDDTSAAIAFDATAAEIKTALELLDNVGADEILVSRTGTGPITLEYDGTLGDLDVSAATADGSLLTCAEVQTIDLSGDLDPVAGTFTITWEGQTTAALAHDVPAAQMETALKALSNIGPNDISVSKAAFVYTLTFAGDLSPGNQDQATSTSSLLAVGATGSSVTEDTAGSAGAGVVRAGEAAVVDLADDDLPTVLAAGVVIAPTSLNTGPNKSKVARGFSTFTS